MLEHLPLSELDKIIKQMRQNAKHLIISLPYRSVKIKFSWQFYKYQEKILFMRIPTFWQKFDINRQGRGEHYWEIGCRQCSLKYIETIFKKYAKIEKSYYIPQNLYHHFFILTTNF